MNRDKFSTPVNPSALRSSALRTTARKRDTLAAELERGPSPLISLYPTTAC